MQQELWEWLDRAKPCLSFTLKGLWLLGLGSGEREGMRVGWEEVSGPWGTKPPGLAGGGLQHEGGRRATSRSGAGWCQESSAFRRGGEGAGRDRFPGEIRGLLGRVKFNISPPP